VSNGKDSGSPDIPEGEGRQRVELKSMSGSAASQGSGCSADVTVLSQLQQYINTVGMDTRADILADKRL
jgi:hypothetical protein